MSTAKDRSRPPAAKPFTPKLAPNATTLRTVPAPRLAAHFSTANTPPLRRPLSATATDTSRTQTSGSVTPPVDSIIASNITPRSSPRSARRSRTDSIQSTPTGLGVTPSETPRQSPFQQRPAVSTSPTRSAASDQVHSPLSRDVLYNSPTSHLETRLDDGNSSFFHANEAPSQPTKRPILQKQTSSFLYANGQQEAADTSRSDPASLTSSVAPSDVSGNPAQTISPSLVSPRLANGQNSTSTYSPSPAVMHAFPSSVLRSRSPPKDNFHLSYRKGVSQIIPPNSLAEGTSSPPRTPPLFTNVGRRRQPSLDTVSDLAERETPSSVSSQGHEPTRRVSLDRAGVSGFPGRTTGQRLPPIPSPQEVKTLDKSFFPPTAQDLPAPLASPTIRSVASPDQIVSETPGAVEARRQRKLLDLEISNSSLLAINRSLEREVRKQKTELRRFRRLTRSGAGFQSIDSRSTSWLSATTDADFVLPEEEDSEQETDEDGAGSGELGEEEEEEEEEEVEEEDLESATFARTRRSDARRLRLDLTKHRELLADSQKMNLSLRRCLGLSEQMIGEAQRALEEKVRVSEVKWGGRVLAAEEGDESEIDDQLASIREGTPSKTSPMLPLEPDPTDVDSGIDVGRLSAEFGDDTDRVSRRLGIERLLRSPMSMEEGF